MTLSDEEIAAKIHDYEKWRASIEPTLDLVADHSERIYALELSGAQEEQRMNAIALKAAEQVVSQSRGNRWVPVIVALIGSGGLGTAVILTVLQTLSTYIERILQVTGATP